MTLAHPCRALCDSLEYAFGPGWRPAFGTLTWAKDVLCTDDMSPTRTHGVNSPSLLADELPVSRQTMG
jgi:hypothetical protein